ncbi:MAG TPA: addiction module protein [Pyrinomonadaceae bacterium]|nr:addiction module protein [Pyrinomonadaceae bacterium]
MTTEEKLQAMEALWVDLTANENEFESPAWHAQVLQEREERIKAGQESFIDWEIAKEQLRQGYDEDTNPSVSEK